MFTGIIETTGTVKKVRALKSDTHLKVFSALDADAFKKGTSISINGVCTTVEDFDKQAGLFSVTLVEETLNRTNFKDIKTGAVVNLEKSLCLKDVLAGHFVSGHVDCTARVLTSPPQLELEIPKKFLRFMPEKGSVAVNGVSLTIAKRKLKSVVFALIPTTLRETNLGLLKKNDVVNIEIDMIARYLDALNT